MTAKEYLSRAELLDKSISCKLHQIEMLRELTQQTTVRYDQESVDRTRDTSSLQTAIAKLIDAENELNRQIDELLDTKAEIAIMIGRVQDISEQSILKKRYLDFQNWETIIVEMPNCRREVFRKHRKALDEIENYLREQETGV